MSAGTLLLAGLAGGVGSVARFLLDGAVARRTGATVPLGTFAVNLSGALALGLVAGFAWPAAATTVVGTGLVGGYTTFSTWMLETERLGEERRVGWAVANVGVSLVLGVLAVLAGRALAGG